MNNYRQHYVSGSAARKIEEYYYGETQPDFTINRKKKVQGKGRQFRLVFTISTLSICVVCLVAIAKYAAITELNYSIDAATIEYNKVKNENMRLVVDLRDKTDLSNIKKIAEEKLGMRRPEAYQTAYIRVPKKDYTRKSEQESQTPVGNKGLVKVAIDNISRAFKSFF